MGRPSKFDGVDLVKVRKLAVAGWTDAQMADFFGVTEQTWNNWKTAHPEFFESIKDWRLEADNRVERSLYERATGYTCPETKTASHEGKITDQVTVEKHYPPETTAAIFWLKNRQPDKWRDKKEVAVVDVGGELDKARERVKKGVVDDA